MLLTSTTMSMVESIPVQSPLLEPPSSASCTAANTGIHRQSDNGKSYSPTHSNGNILCTPTSLLNGNPTIGNNMETQSCNCVQLSESALNPSLVKFTSSRTSSATDEGGCTLQDSQPINDNRNRGPIFGDDQNGNTESSNHNSYSSDKVDVPLGPDPNHSGVKQLKLLYSRGKRIQEIVSIVICISLFILNGVTLLKKVEIAHLPTILVAAFFGILAADFLSGLVHWSADTWGSVDLPGLGANFIRPFREHHIDPTLIIKHDFVETNGDNFMLPILPLFFLLINLTSSPTFYENHIGGIYFTFLLAIFVALTNQIHKWSHTYSGLPTWVKVLQKYRLILSQSGHRVHHQSNHQSYYCITTGWLNLPLERLGFWKKLERWIERLTGYQPREDDLKWAHQIYNSTNNEKSSSSIDVPCSKKGSERNIIESKINGTITNHNQYNHVHLHGD